MSSLPSRKTRPAATSMAFMRAEIEVMGRRWSHPEKHHASRSASNAFVNESQPLHLGGIKQVAAIEENRMRERLARALQVELLEFVPLGCHDKRIAAFGDII